MGPKDALPSPPAGPQKPARITYLKVENFRALRKVEFKNLTPLTVLLGPNGSGKSTVFDVFAFLSECFESGLRRAWDRRGRAKELKTRGSDGTSGHRNKIPRTRLSANYVPSGGR